MFYSCQKVSREGVFGILAHFQDFSAVVPSTGPVPVVCEFLEVFPVDLPRMPPDHDIDFGTDL